MRPSQPRRPVVAGLLAAVVGASLAGAPGASAAPGPTGGYLVATTAGSTAALAAHLRSQGVTVTRELGVLGVLGVRGSSADAARLAADPRVTGVMADRGTTLQSDNWYPTTNAGSLYNASVEVGARSQWPMGTGRGIDVAVLDSGVSPVPGLDGQGKLMAGPDLSFDSQVPAMRNQDGFGHGTHMASIIAGQDASLSGAGDTTSFAGIAPGARIVSVKVADAYGNADVSQVIAGIDWVVQHRKDPGMNIRVLNLSVGLPSGNDYTVDPLAHAAEQAWLAGIVVVASGGNNGKANGQLLSPAYDPYILAVGSSDNRGTVEPTDDLVADFSNQGTSLRSPDVVAPGRRVAGLRVPGSYLDQQNPAAQIGGRYIRGSGTSQAAAVTSGTVALLLGRRPTLTPDQVKQALVKTAKPLPGVATVEQGKGKVQVDKAFAAGVTTVAQSFRRSTGTGALDATRGGDPVESNGVTLSGQKDIFGRAFDSGRHAGLAATGTAWTAGSWNGSVLTGSSWSTPTAYGPATWTGRDWAGMSWATGRASVAVSWDGRSWAGGYWNGRSWAGRSWAGRSWADASWG